MAINIRTKGATGEREVIGILETVLFRVLDKMGCPAEERVKWHKVFQRNQNQSAVGGNDLCNTFDLSIEVKRQEQLSVNTWWRQCTAAATKAGETPVLIYRQNRKPWRVVTYVWLPLPDGGHATARAEIDIDTFKVWFEHWVHRKILAGWKPQS